LQTRSYGDSGVENRLSGSPTAQNARERSVVSIAADPRDWAASAPVPHFVTIYIRLQQA
jgi:hypothetical protein